MYGPLFLLPVWPSHLARAGYSQGEGCFYLASPIWLMGKGKLLARQVGSRSKARLGAGSKGREVRKTSQSQGIWKRAPYTLVQPLPPSLAVISHSVLCQCAEGACPPRFFFQQEALWSWVEPDATRPSVHKVVG